MIRNTKQTYDVRAISNVSSTKTGYTAKARQEFNMKGEEIRLVEFTVSQKKKKGEQVKPDNALWQGCVETTREGRLAQKGAGIGNVLVTVRNGLIHLPVLCANDHRNQEVEIKPKDTQVKIMAVHVTYERRDVEGNKVDYDWVKKNVNHIQVQDFTGPHGDIDETKGTRAPMSLAESQTTFSTRTNFPLESKPSDVTKDRGFLTRPATAHLDPLITRHQKQDLEELLDDFADLFSQTKTDIGRTSVIEHDIVLEAGSRPFKETMRRMAPDKRKMADEQIQLLIEMGVIRPSNSPFASAVVLANKNDGSKRFCMDFRKLNDLTIKDAFPLPRIDDTLETLGTAKFFTSLDMGSAFWQVELTEEAVPKTAFSTTNGLYEWTRMPFGL